MEDECSEDGPCRKYLKLEETKMEDELVTSPLIEILDDNCSTDADQEILSNVFSNHLIWGTLGSYLNFNDLKDCRLVCSLFNRGVMDSADFKKRAKVVLGPQDIRLTEFGRTNERWRNVSICVHSACEQNNCMMEDAKSDENLSWFYPLLEEVEYLSLGGYPECCPVETLKSIVHQLLRAPKNLKSLKLTEPWLNHGADAFDGCVQVLNNLQELELDALRGNRYWADNHSPVQALTTLVSSARNLKAFKVSTGSERELNNSDYARQQSMTATMLTLESVLQINNATLERLNVTDSNVWRTSMKPFPALRSLCLVVKAADETLLAQFLRPLNKLEEVDITFLGSFNACLIRLILKIPSLKRLRLKAREFRCRANDWSSLQRLKLEEFHLHLTEPSLWFSDDFHVQLIMHLPPTVKKIFIRGLSILPPNHPAEITGFHGVRPEIMTQLNLCHCHGFVTDVTMEFICKRMTKLVDLNLARADRRLTDYGCTGRILEQDVPEFSLSNLKGLKSLSLKMCEGLTDMTLIHAIQFLELKYLDLTGCNVTAVGCKAVLSHNPSLEILRTDDIGGMPSDEELKVTCPRLQEYDINTLGDDSDDDEYPAEQSIPSDSDSVSEDDFDFFDLDDDDYGFDFDYGYDDWF